MEPPSRLLSSSTVRLSDCCLATSTVGLGPWFFCSITQSAAPMMRAAPMRLHPEGVVPQTIRSRISAKTSCVYCDRRNCVSKVYLLTSPIRLGDRTYNEISCPPGFLSLQALGQEKLERETSDADGNKKKPNNINVSRKLVSSGFVPKNSSL